MTPPTFKPSQVRLDRSYPPFVDTFERTEAEIAVALLVRALQVHGDAWRAVTRDEMKATIDADVAAKQDPLASLVRNPFSRPDFHGLVEAGFAEEREGSIALTEKALATLLEKHHVVLEIHTLRTGAAPCGLPGLPVDWPRGHFWTTEDADKVTCSGCKAALAPAAP